MENKLYINGLMPNNIEFRNGDNILRVRVPDTVTITGIVGYDRKTGEFIFQVQQLTDEGVMQHTSAFGLKLACEFIGYDINKLINDETKFYLLGEVVGVIRSEVKIDRLWHPHLRLYPVASDYETYLIDIDGVDLETVYYSTVPKLDMQSMVLGFVKMHKQEFEADICKTLAGTLYKHTNECIALLDACSLILDKEEKSAENDKIGVSVAGLKDAIVAYCKLYEEWSAAMKASDGVFNKKVQFLGEDVSFEDVVYTLAEILSESHIFACIEP